MGWTLLECVRQIKQEYPDFYPDVYVEVGGLYLFNLKPKNATGDFTMMDFHVVDPEKHVITGAIPPMTILGDPEISKKLDSPKKVPDDLAVEHSALPSSDAKDRQWRIRFTPTTKKKTEANE